MCRGCLRRGRRLSASEVQCMCIGGHGAYHELYMLIEFDA